MKKLCATLMLASALCAGATEKAEARKGGAGLPSSRAVRAAVWQAPAENFLTGTYREKASKDEEIGRRAMAATAHLDSDERQRQGRALMRILRAPTLFAIEQYGTTITMNYPGGTRIPYEADGRARVFRATGGESINVRAYLEGRTLTIDLTWSGGERLHMIYESPAGGGKIVYTRATVNSSLSGAVTVTSEYERVSPKATRTFAGLVPKSEQ